MPSRKELANAIRALSMDAVEQAQSGHPGMPMGMADIAEVLWNDYLVHNPANPHWADRDRFVLSNGHGSMLHYSLLHLSGYDLPMEELKNFRQLHSKTPGHPEYGYTPGIETTTGPLGQGLANGVGMALAEKILAARYNQDGHQVVDHYTYVFAGDGCLMEGVSHEACSLAGTLGLGKLIVFYDDNGISIDGEVEGWFTDDTAKRFEGYNWQVIRDVDGHDAEAVKRAIEQARSDAGRPTLICARTVIGFGAPNKAGTESVHGAALGADEVAATREQIGWKHEPFVIPQDVYQSWDARERGQRAESEWIERMAAYEKAYPELAGELNRRLKGELPADWQEQIDAVVAGIAAKGENAATRKASQGVLNELGPRLPELLGGSADLTGSNNTNWKGCTTLTPEQFDANYIHYGVREFGMSAMINGIALHGGFIPFGGTFLIFSDYARNAVRMAALMKVPSIFVYTHDSIGLGEDGPTHQPIEQLATLRLIPNMEVWRPADTVETAVAWRAAIERRDGPVSLALSRQGASFYERDEATMANIRRGGYVLREAQGDLNAIVLATGTEVGQAVEAAEALNAEGIGTRVVSMPCTDVFEQQDAAYQESVLPAGVAARVALEAAVPEYWYRFVGAKGRVIGMNRFGESAPAKDLYNHFGITTDAVKQAVKETVGS